MEIAKGLKITDRSVILDFNFLQMLNLTLRMAQYNCNIAINGVQKACLQNCKTSSRILFFKKINRSRWQPKVPVAKLKETVCECVTEVHY